MLKSACWNSCLLILLLCFLSTANRLSAQDFSLLDAQFSSSSVLAKHHYGFCLYDLDSNRFVFGKQEDHYFKPASNTKVFTLFTALKLLKDSIPGLQYVEHGDSLIFWGTGDPTFLHPKLDSRIVYNFLRDTPKKLFYVAQKREEPNYRDGWAIEDYACDYQPDVAPFPIYGNLVRFNVKHGELRAVPDYFNRFMHVDYESEPGFSVKRALNTNSFEVGMAAVKPTYRSSKPFIWSDSLLLELLQDTLRREIDLLTDYTKPADVLTLYSNPKDKVLREMMLPSDNFLAEHLEMMAALTSYAEFNTKALRKDMKKAYYSLFMDDVELRDASGLSTYNQVTPRSMVEVLLAIQEVISDDSQRNFFFPAGGIDGTLKNAYALDQGLPFIWAKTGTIHAVHCQSGYIVTRSGKRYAYSFLNNNFKTSTAKIRQEMVRMMTFIRQNY